MVKIQGENYNINIQEKLIELQPMVNSLPAISINANNQEDFSIFELGPYIANHVILSVSNCTIDSFEYANSCITVDQEPGNFIQIIIREPRKREENPIDSGNIIYTFRDYVVKYLD